MNNAEFTAADRKIMVAPAGGVKSSKPVLIGRTFGFPVADQAAGKRFTLIHTVSAIVTVEAKGAQLKQGDVVYFKAGRAKAEFHTDATEVGSIRVGEAQKLPGAADCPASGVLAAVNEVKALVVDIFRTGSAPVA